MRPSQAVPTPRRPAAEQPERRERQVTFRMDLTLWHKLQAAAATLNLSQAQIVSDALNGYLDALPPRDRQIIDTLLTRRRQKP